jgi:hypothetical protein
VTKFQAVVSVAMLALSSSLAVAEPGFFRKPLPEGREAPPVEETTSAEAKDEAVTTCAMHVLFNTRAPHAVTLKYLGTSACFSGYRPAIAAVASLFPSAKEDMGPRPTPTPVYDCGVMVGFEPGEPSQVTQSFTGAGCESSRSTALTAARQLVLQHPNFGR